MTDLHRQQAQTLRKALAAQGYTLKHGHVLEVLAALHGLPNWDTLSARPDTRRLPSPAGDLALQQALARYGVILGVDACAALTEQLPARLPPVRALLHPDELSVMWFTTPGGLLLLRNSTEIAPWPLLPSTPAFTQAMAKVLSKARSLTWAVGGELQVDGQPVRDDHGQAVPEWTDQAGETVQTWHQVLQSAVMGTSHDLGGSKGHDGSVIQVSLRRGVNAPPAARELHARQALSVVYSLPGGPGRDRATLALSLAYGAAATGVSYLHASELLVGQAAESLQGPCQLLRGTPQYTLTFLAARGAAGDTLTTHVSADGWEALAREAQRRGMRLIVTMHAAGWQDALDSLAAHGITGQATCYHVDQEGKVREYLTDAERLHSIRVGEARQDYRPLSEVLPPSTSESEVRLETLLQADQGDQATFLAGMLSAAAESPPTFRASLTQETPPVNTEPHNDASHRFAAHIQSLSEAEGRAEYGDRWEEVKRLPELLQEIERRNAAAPAGMRWMLDESSPTTRMPALFAALGQLRTSAPDPSAEAPEESGHPLEQGNLSSEQG